MNIDENHSLKDLERLKRKIEKQIEAKNSEAINKKIDRKRKASQNKAKGPGINSANLKR